MIAKRSVYLSACHNVGIHVSRIYRVGYQHLVRRVENIKYIAQIALCAVAYKYLVGRYLNFLIGIVISDRVAQKVVSLLGTVTAESLLPAHFVDRLVHSFDYCRNERQSHVAYAKSIHLDSGVSRLKFFYFFCHRRK